MRYWLAVRTKIQDLIRQDNRKRYMLASQTNGEEAGFPATPGHCTWCGKPVPRKNQRFCPGIITHEYTTRDADGQRTRVHRTRRYDCYNAFFVYWVHIPRFKRVVFRRDDFTCQACGRRPTWTNKHGIEFPDVNQLCCDHIKPLSKGGPTELWNLQTLCRKCNEAKGDKLNWKPDCIVDLDEWFQIWAAEKVARESGMTFHWERGPDGLIMSMGRTNDNANALSSEGRGPGR